MKQEPEHEPGAQEMAEAALRRQRAEELCQRALAYSPDERAARSREWCGNDAALFSEVLELLAAYAPSTEERELEPLTPGSTGSGLLTRSQDSVPDSEDEGDPWVGRTLGPFRLERLLGRGGMGIVYLGRRKTGGFEQTVAVKLVAKHMTSAPALAQFLMERDALALLEHKNIARLLDGGVTTESLPYVVMEYVEGRTLDRFCEDPGTSLETVLRLMIQLCEAVDYVHRNLILHRDLKPGNVMVTTEGKVKLLDFGTVKLIGPEAVDSALTQAGMRPLTLRYASPEHIKADTVTTASDVYSLGMILYRLLAGRVPESLEDGRIKSPTDARARELAAGRPAGAPRSVMQPQMARDLDAIVLKAIRYEPEMRYATAGAMAADLELTLQDRPVGARKGTLSYRAGKYYRRHTGAIYVCAAVLLVLALGLAAMARESVLARREQVRAEAGVGEEEKLTHALLFTFFDDLKQIPGSTDAQRKTVTDSLQFLDGLAGSRVAAGSSLEEDEVEGYMNMGQLLGSSYEENLGDIPGGIRAMEKAVTIAKSMVGRDPHNLKKLGELAMAEDQLGVIYLGSGDAKKALLYIQPAAEASATIAADPQATAVMLSKAAGVWDTFGDLYADDGAASLGDASRALEHYQQAKAFDEKAVTIDPACIRCRQGLPLEALKMGLSLEDTDFQRAEEYFRQALATVAQFPPEQLKATRSVRIRTAIEEELCKMEVLDGKAAEGVSLLQPEQQRLMAQVAADKLDSRVHFDLVVADNDLAEAYEAAGDLQGSLKADQDLLANMNFLLQRDPEDARWQFEHAYALLRLADMQRQTGDAAEADRTLHDGLERMTALAVKKDPMTDALKLAARTMVDEAKRSPGSAAAAPQNLKRALEFAQRSVDMTPRPTPDQLLALADAKSAIGDAAGAKDLAAKIAALTTSPTGKSSLDGDDQKDVKRMLAAK